MKEIVKQNNFVQINHGKDQGNQQKISLSSSWTRDCCTTPSSQIPSTWPKILTGNRSESPEKSDNKLIEQVNRSENRTVEQQLLDVREQRSKLYEHKKFV